MNETVKKIRDMIEQARAAGELGNDQARAASVALDLEGDEAMLACRLVAQGADPASLDYLDTGEVDPLVAQAHVSGPGVYDLNDPKLVDYLALCALSADESQESTLRGRFHGFVRAMSVLGMQDEQLREQIMEALGQAELRKIRQLPYASSVVVGGLAMRVYGSDRGFAAATWDGLDVAAVVGSYNGEPYVAVGAPPSAPTLDEQGVKVDKNLSPRFGIIEDRDEVARILREVS